MRKWSKIPNLLKSGNFRSVRVGSGQFAKSLNRVTWTEMRALTPTHEGWKCHLVSRMADYHTSSRFMNWRYLRGRHSNRTGEKYKDFASIFGAHWNRTPLRRQLCPFRQESLWKIVRCTSALGKSVFPIHSELFTCWLTVNVPARVPFLSRYYIFV